jgi:hypothetical protein
MSKLPHPSNEDFTNLSWWKKNFYGNNEQEREDNCSDRKEEELHEESSSNANNEESFINGMINQVKGMYNLCWTNEESSKYEEQIKAETLVQQYELFIMEEDENIEEMFKRFQNLIVGLKEVDRHYNKTDQILKILRSLPCEWEHVSTQIEEREDFDKMCLESLISYLKSHEVILKGRSDKKDNFVKEEKGA